VSNRRWTTPETPFRIVTRRTRDVKIPLFEGGEDLLRHGWRCIPIPPGDPFYEDWEIFDSSHDYKTTWFRRCADYVVEARLGGGRRDKKSTLLTRAWLKPR
jgi:hypothetical protein